MNIIQIYKNFPTEKHCIRHIEKIRWALIPKCPYCKSENTTEMASESRHHCNNCNTSFSVTVGTVFHRTHIPLQKWFLTIYLVLNAKKGISARKLARDVEVNKNTAWSMQMKIRHTLIQEREFFSGILEMDEIYVG
jgi:transposase-like protein